MNLVIQIVEPFSGHVRADNRQSVDKLNVEASFDRLVATVSANDALLVGFCVNVGLVIHLFSVNVFLFTY